ncbi:MAG TPA: hypothetical protein DCR21_08005 [Succinivibrionaceae bacterium]|nr:hypothetical protein [Succinivibrio sp.]HAR80758.1 hypothetical protein [Succinivibrionaceae bacterium]
MSSPNDIDLLSGQDLNEQRKMVSAFLKDHNHYNQVLGLKDCDPEIETFIRIIYLAKSKTSDKVQITSIKKI